jgi:hypothetical protein
MRQGNTNWHQLAPRASQPGADRSKKKEKTAWLTQPSNHIGGWGAGSTLQTAVIGAESSWLLF